MNIFCWILLVGITGFCSSSFAWAGGAPLDFQSNNGKTDPNAHVLKVGIVPQYETHKLHAIWQPILDFLKTETGLTFKLVGSATIPKFEKQLDNAEFDLSYMNPYHLVLANQRNGYIPILKDKAKQLKGILVANKEGKIKSPKDLDGKTIAFPAPNALGASLQMRQELKDLFNIDFTPVYVKTHDSVYYNVVLGQAAAGGGVQKTLNQQPEKIKNRLQVIHTTTPVSSHPIAVHPRVKEDVKNAIVNAIIKLSNTNEGQKLLSKIPIKKIGTTTLDDYSSLNAMHLERFYAEP